MHREDAKIIEIQNAPQYRVIKTQEQYFLIDTDNNKLGIFFFPLNWLLPQKGYKLVETDCRNLFVNQKNGPIGKILITLAAVVGAIWGRFSTIRLENTRTYPDSLIILVFLTVIISSIILRYFIGQLRGKKVKKIVDLNERQTVTIYIRPKFINLQMIGFLLLYFLFLILIFSTIMLLFRYHSLILVGLLLLFILSLSFMNAAAFREGKYRIKW